MAEQTITPPQRIRELSDINTDVAAMLTSAGQAINALTNRPIKAADGDAEMTDEASNSVDAHKKAFTDNTEAFYATVHAVFARLRRQAYAIDDSIVIGAWLLASDSDSEHTRARKTKAHLKRCGGGAKRGVRD